MTLSTHFCCFPEYAFKMYEKCKEDFRWKSLNLPENDDSETLPKIQQIKRLSNFNIKKQQTDSRHFFQAAKTSTRNSRKKNFSLKSITCGDSPGRLALINFSSSLYNALYAINTCCNFNNILSDNNREMASRTEIQL